MSARALFLFLIGLSLSSAALAQPSIDDFKRGWSAARQGNSGARDGALAAMGADHPLRAYVIYADLRRRLDRGDTSAVAGFLKTHADLPLADILRRRLLKHLAARKEWDAFLDAYQSGLGEHYDCLATQAWQAQPQRAPDDQTIRVRNLWRVGYSQDDACNPAFRILLDQGQIDADLASERLALTMNNGEFELSRYLHRFLTRADQHRARQWYDNRYRPHQLLRLARDWPSGKLRDAAWQFGLGRIIGDDLEDAEYWLEQDASKALPAAALERMRYQHVLTALTEFHPKAFDWWQSLPAAAIDEALLAWRVRYHLRARDWQAVLKGIAALPEPYDQRDYWQFWKAEALLELDRDEQAAEILHRLSEESSYYGFLAADALQRGYVLCGAANEPLPSFASLVPAAQRALLLHQAGFDSYARREWWRFQLDASQADIRAAADHASAQDWHFAAITALANIGDWQAYESRFPLWQQQLISAEARRNGLNPSFVYAIIRAESAFQADARSSADALGLMQITPATANTIARKHRDLPRVNRWQLLDPKTNLRMGTRNLADLFDRLGSDYWLVPAAYNAGPGKARQWQRDADGLDIPLLIETMDYRETREYTKRVLAFAIIYDWRMGRDIKRLSSRFNGQAARQNAKAYCPATERSVELAAAEQ